MIARKLTLSISREVVLLGHVSVASQWCLIICAMEGHYIITVHPWGRCRCGVGKFLSSDNISHHTIIGNKVIIPFPHRKSYDDTPDYIVWIMDGISLKELKILLQKGFPMANHTWLDEIF